MSALKKILLFIFSVFLALFICEGTFRIMIYFNLIDYPSPDFKRIFHKYSKNKELIYELKPNWTTRDGILSTNKFGMRDYEYSLTKPERVTRIAVVGDSVAFGYRHTGPIPLEKIFAKLLEVKLNNAYGPGKFEVLNFSVTGYDALQEEIIIEEKVLKFSVDYIIVCYVTNDDTYTDGLGDLTKAMSPYSLGSRLHSKLVSYVLSKHDQIKYHQERDIKKVWHLFDKLNLLKRNKNIGIIILMTPDNKSVYPLDPKYKLVKRRAKLYGFDVVDPNEKWKDETNEFWYALYTPKDSHYSPFGMQYVADMLFDFFQDEKKTGDL